MEREYSLNPDRKFRGRSSHPVEPSVAGLRSGSPEDDALPYHRKIGDELSWTHMEGFFPRGKRTGVVRQINGGITLIECQGKWFTEDANGITEIEPSVCPTCSSFPCAQDCHAHPPTIQMNPVPYRDLATYAQKQLIPCVEGRLKYLNAPKAYKSGVNEGKPYQYGTITEIGTNLEIGVKFELDLVQDVSNKGKVIRLEAHQGSKGLSGVYMDIGEYDGKETRTARCTATAVIQYIAQGDAAANRPQTPQAASAPSSATQTPPARQDAQNRLSEPNRGYPQEESTVEERVGAWLQIAEEVCRQISKPFEGFMEGLSSTDIKEITTGIAMSYKGQYGVYQAPLFDSQVGGNRSASAGSPPAQVVSHVIPSWKDFVNAKSPGGPKKLGDYDDATFIKLAAWAYNPKTNMNNNETKVLAANVRMGVVEKGVARSVFLALFAAESGYGSEFDEQDLETVCGEQNGKASQNLTPAEWEQALDQFSAIIQDCRTAHTNAGDDIPF